MLTILEGPDGGGKSTFGKWLTEHNRAILLHHGPYPAEKRISQHYWRSFPLSREQHCVLDRSWLSEPIYAEAWRGTPSRINVAERRMLERIAFGNQVVVACIQPSLKVCLDRWGARRKDEYVKDANKFEHVFGLYQNLDTDLPLARFDEIVPDYQGWVEVLDEMRSPYNAGPGVGWFSQNSVVLLGDRPSNERWRADWPFCSYSGCSPWLAEQLEEADIPESRLYWVNSTSAQGAPLPLDWLFDHEFVRVIALGVNAERALRAAGRRYMTELVYTAIEHPQHHRRFLRQEPYELIENILIALGEKRP